MQQGELAALMGISQTRLSTLERGDPWALDQVGAAADALGVHPADLLPLKPSPVDRPEFARVLDMLRAGAYLDAVDLIMCLRWAR